MTMSDGRCDICGGEDAEYIEVDDHCEYRCRGCEFVVEEIDEIDEIDEDFPYHF
jgi:hypothetical protein